MLDTVLHLGPLGFVSMESYQEEMNDEVCSTLLWSKWHLQVHLRKAGLISEAEIGLHLSRNGSRCQLRLST